MPGQEDQVDQTEVLMFQEELSTIDMVMEAQVSDAKMIQIRELTKRDASLQKLSNVVRSGWPDKKEQLPEDIKQYLSLRDEITVDDGILFRGNTVIIPTEMRSETIQKIHACVAPRSEWLPAPVQGTVSTGRAWHRESGNM